MSEENKENMQQNEGVKINIKSPEAEVAENAEELQEAENQAEETDMGGGEIGILKKQVAAFQTYGVGRENAELSKTASARARPGRVSGRESARRSFQTHGIGRGDAELS